MRQVGVAVFTVLLALSTTMSAQTSKASSAKKKAPSIDKRLADMQQAIEAQQSQINQLMQQLQKRDQTIEQLQQQVNQVQSTASEASQKADTASSKTAPVEDEVSAVKKDVTDLKENVTSTALSLQDTQKKVNDMESPLAIHYKGITITPGGFMAAETVWRQRGTAGGINTPLNGIPFTATNQGNLSEFRGSGRQSRVAMLVEGKLKSAKIGGYLEADFLSAGVTSNNNQSNSYTMRQRQFWAQAALASGWTFTGGQMWSLATETANGVDNRTETLPMTIDPQYTVGFSWARQYGFRVSKKIGEHFWLAGSVENSQETFAAHGQNANFVLGAPGNGGGLYNPTSTYSFSPSPDVILKAVAQNKVAHFELFGVLTEFKSRLFPCATAGAEDTCNNIVGPSSAGAYNDSRTGGGIGANARFSLVNKQVVLGVHFLGGDGVGRYGTTSLPDVTVRPDGTLAPIHSYQGLGTFEIHKKKFDIYLNYGGEYAARTWYTDPVSGKAMGYGSPAFSNSGCGTEPLPGSGGFAPGSQSGCTGDTRLITELSTGFWYRLYNGPKGKVQFGPQYSFVQRNAWSGDGGQPTATENMWFTSFRYYLP
jgi:peptidoglycan hydrolase CwlO-like protein